MMAYKPMLAFLLLTVILLVNANVSSPKMKAWRKDRMPKLYGDKVKHWHLDPKFTKVQRKIVHFHNRFRTRVQPKASNMLTMSWHRGAARDAQLWADSCQLLVHANETGRWQHNFGACGQNIFVSTHKVPWYFAMKNWFLERDIFQYGSENNSLSEVGHYTQMVWFATHKVGCGWTHCKDAEPEPFYNYVCNYCPSGNFGERLGRPYDAGRPCSNCRRACNNKKQLCTNTCPWTDRWSNCAELKKLDRIWTCGTRRRQKRTCLATCRCRNRIHYP